MSSIIAYIQAHPTTFSLLGFYIGSAFIGSLPAPTVSSSVFYQFLFKFLNTVGANLTRAFSQNLPVASAQAKGLADAQQAQGVPIDPPRQIVPGRPAVVAPPPPGPKI